MSALSEAVLRVFEPGDRILVAVSGGMDSMVLLHVLHALSAEGRWKLHVAHLNHCLRGRSSDADERLVSRTAQRLKIPFEISRKDIRALAKASGISIEMAARQARHEFLAEVARSRRISKIALAHHADDQVELFFLRLLRGTSPEGLAGMAQSSPSAVDPALTLVRPLVQFSKRELLAYAKEHRVAFREDRTNQSLDILRNRIRHELLPVLRKKYQPAIDVTALRLMRILRDESRLLESTLAEARKNIRTAADFEKLPVALQRRYFGEQLSELGVQPSFELIERLRRNQSALEMIAPGRFLQREPNGRLEIVPAGKVNWDGGEWPLDLQLGEGKALVSGVKLHWAITALSKASLRRLKWTSGSESFDAEKVGQSIVLRHWKPGDRFQPIGMRKPVKLQDLFVNNKIERSKRHKLLIAATAADEIVWVEGFRISERFKLDNFSRKRLKWTWCRL